MKVELVSLTQDPIKQMYFGASRCRSSGDLSIYESAGMDVMKRVVESCIESGHLTVAEFVDMTFDVQGVDLNTVMQYLRHRHFSTLQRSGRHVVVGTAPEIEQVCVAFESNNEEELRKIVSDYFLVPDCCVRSAALAMISYHNALKSGVPVEQARRVLPQGMLTDLRIHCNFRALIEASRLRLCYRAQGEIRSLFEQFKEELEWVSPEGAWMSKFLQRKCEALHQCNEVNSCGYYHLAERSQDGQGKESGQC